MKPQLILFLTLLLLSFTTVACEKEGNAEKAGREIDKAFNAAKEKVQEVTK